MGINLDAVKSDESAFLRSLANMSEIDQVNLVTETKIAVLAAFSKELPGTFVEMLSTISPRAQAEFERKMTLGASPARPDNQSFAIVSVNNMRQRSLVQLILVGMVAYMNRALKERTQDANGNTAHYFLDSFDSEEAAVIKRFLNLLFEYNPTENIDRLTSELIAPEMDSRRKTVNTQTATVKVKSEPTSVIDSTIRAKAGENKRKTVERSSAELEFVPTADEIAAGHTPDPYTVKIDPPLDFYAKFMNYYNTHYDAIHRTAKELFIENRIEDGKYVREEVIIRELDPADATKSQVIRRFELPIANQQWDQSITVYSPKSGGFFTNAADAEHELRVIKDRTVSDMIIVETNKPVLTASWHAGRANVIIEDEHAAAILKRFDDDRKMYNQMNNQRVKQSVFVNMIENGETGDDFKEYIREFAPQHANRSLDEWDEDELKTTYHRWVADNKIFSNADKDFMSFVIQRNPGRDFGKQPMTRDERRQWSREYATHEGAAEITQDEIMALDLYQIGTTDVNEKPTVAKKREYFHGSTNVKSK